MSVAERRRNPDRRSTHRHTIDPKKVYSVAVHCAANITPSLVPGGISKQKLLVTSTPYTCVPKVCCAQKLFTGTVCFLCAALCTTPNQVGLGAGGCTNPRTTLQFFPKGRPGLGAGPRLAQSVSGGRGWECILCEFYTVEKRRESHLITRTHPIKRQICEPIVLDKTSNNMQLRRRKWNARWWGRYSMLVS